MESGIGAVFRVGVAALFLVGATAKARDVRAFDEIIRAMRLVPNAAVRSVAIAVITTETVVGLALLFGSQIGIWSAILVLAAFTVALTASTLRGTTGDCGCLGSVIPGRIGWAAVARNVALLALLTGLSWVGT